MNWREKSERISLREHSPRSAQNRDPEVQSSRRNDQPGCRLHRHGSIEGCFSAGHHGWDEKGLRSLQPREGGMSLYSHITPPSFNPEADPLEQCDVILKWASHNLPEVWRANGIAEREQLSPMLRLMLVAAMLVHTRCEYTKQAIELSAMRSIQVFVPAIPENTLPVPSE